MDIDRSNPECTVRKNNQGTGVKYKANIYKSKEAFPYKQVDTPMNMKEGDTH